MQSFLPFKWEAGLTDFNFERNFPGEEEKEELEQNRKIEEKEEEQNKKVYSEKKLREENIQNYFLNFFSTDKNFVFLHVFSLFLRVVSSSSHFSCI